MERLQIFTDFQKIAPKKYESAKKRLGTDDVKFRCLMEKVSGFQVCLDQVK